MAEQKRGSDYFIKILARDHPAILADYHAGKYRSVNEACRAAGLKTARTRLHEIKNAWSKATAGERHDFIAWVRKAAAATSPTSVAAATSAAAAAVIAPAPLVAKKASKKRVVRRLLEPWESARIQHILQARRMKPADPMAELGSANRHDASISGASKGHTTIDTKWNVALANWLAANSRV